MILIRMVQFVKIVLERIHVFNVYVRKYLQMHIVYHLAAS